MTGVGIVGWYALPFIPLLGPVSASMTTKWRVGALPRQPALGWSEKVIATAAIASTMTMIMMEYFDLGFV